MRHADAEERVERDVGVKFEDVGRHAVAEERVERDVGGEV